jgi:hypothetical protein
MGRNCSMYAVITMLISILNQDLRYREYVGFLGLNGKPTIVYTYTECPRRKGQYSVRS